MGNAVRTCQGSRMAVRKSIQITPYLHQEIALGFAEYLFNALKTWVTKVCRDAPRKVNIFKERCILSTKPFMF